MDQTSKAKTSHKKVKKETVSAGQEAEALRILTPLLALYPPIPPDAIKCPLCHTNFHIFPKFYYLLRHFRRTFYHKNDPVLDSCGIRANQKPTVEKLLIIEKPESKPSTNEIQPVKTTPPPPEPTLHSKKLEKFCTHCSKRFRTQHFLALHLERHHKQLELIQPTPPDEFEDFHIDPTTTCRYCLKQFPDPPALRGHLTWHKRRQEDPLLEDCSPKKKKFEPVSLSGPQILQNFSEIRKRELEELEAMRQFSVPIEQLRLSGDFGGKTFFEVMAGITKEGVVLPVDQTPIVPPISQNLLAIDKSTPGKSQSLPSTTGQDCNQLMDNISKHETAPETNEEKLRNAILRFKVKRVLQNLNLGDYQDVDLEFHKAFGCNYCEQEFDTTLEKEAHLKAKHAYFC